ncbi:IS110 family transposase [[Clostridium] symbiosum]|uniref:IS110 family transposase n=1 Tax=Clostridium symbiosum TaxID=1512 RepID=UPI002F41ACF0
MYNAVGIDVSKGKSTIAVLQPGGVIVRKPFDVFHTSQSLKELSNYLASLEGDTRIVMECTGRYHESMANSLLIYKCRVSVPNSQLGLNPLIV